MRVGWREAMSYFRIVGRFLLAALMFATLREPVRRDVVANAEERHRVTLRTVVAHLVSLRSYVLVVVAICFGMLVEFGRINGSPSFTTALREFSLSVSEVGFSLWVNHRCLGRYPRQHSGAASHG